jgi:cysteine-S-conjugate beta-lyase
MTVNFEKVINRREFGSIKWSRHDEDVIPMWLADTDFECPESILAGISRRLEHGIFGYDEEPEELREIVVDRLKRRHGWEVSPDSLIFLTGVVNSINLINRYLLDSGDGVMVHTPAYPPFLTEPEKAGLELQDMPLSPLPDGGYEIDFDAFESAITEKSRLYILCNPHNPTGHVYSRGELERIAQFCLKHDLIICSDDIHCDLVYSESKYTPISSLSREVSSKTITLISPGKTFNTAGMAFSIAVIPDEKMRTKLVEAQKDLDLKVCQLSYLATEIAYSTCDSWEKDLLIYLEANRDLLKNTLEKDLPGVVMKKPEGTFLAWLDCRGLNINGNPQEYLLKQARLAFNDGAPFGKGGEGFVRLNFGCPGPILHKALKRIKKSLV